MVNREDSETRDLSIREEDNPSHEVAKKEEEEENIGFFLFLSFEVFLSVEEEGGRGRTTEACLFLFPLLRLLYFDLIGVSCIFCCLQSKLFFLGTAGDRRDSSSSSWSSS